MTKWFYACWQRIGMLGLLVRGASIALVVQVVGTSVTYFSQFLSARWLGVEEYGSFNYALAWTQGLSVLSGMGLTLAVLQFIPQYLVRQDWERLHGIVYWSRWLTLSVGLVVATITTVFLLIWQPPKADIVTLLLGVWFTPFVALISLQREMFRGLQHIFWSLALPMILQPILFVAAIFGVLQMIRALTSVSMLATFAFAMLITLSAQFYGLFNLLPRGTALTRPVYESTEWLRTCWPLLVTTVCWVVLDQADLLLLGIFSGTREVGVYAAAKKTALLVSFALIAVNSAAVPAISALYAKGDHVALQRMVNIVIQGVFWPALVVCLTFVLFGQSILGLFGADFVAGRQPLALLAIGQLVSASTGPVASFLNLTGHQRQNAWVFGWSALINFLLNLALIPIAGMAGAAIATTITTIMWNIWLVMLVRKYLDVHSYVFAHFIGSRFR